jgi:hypothetical protein
LRLSTPDLASRTPSQFPGNADLSDAELYRIVVADYLRNGWVRSKAEFDAEVRRTSTLEMADQSIAFAASRPGCLAWRRGRKMVCECGNTWSVGDPAPPHCKDLQL